MVRDDPMSSIVDSLKHAESVLAASGIAEPRREAVSLLMLATKKDRTFLYSHPEYTLTQAEAGTLKGFLERRSGREPLQHISGVQEFYGLEFEVTPDVLIPRPETEMIVERAISLLSATGGTLCDLGTGSGCIAVSVLRELENVRAIGLDASPHALEVARRNSQKLGVSDRLQLVVSDLFSALTTGRFAVIASNPPYIPRADMADLQPEVRDFEPHGALTDNLDGLSIISRIIEESPEYLSPGGHLILEIGVDQCEKVAATFDPNVWLKPEISPDLQGIPRMVSARLI